MARETKYRAWVPQDKEFITWDAGTRGDWFWEQVRCGLTPEQFTGQQDKNGKDIYEDDIIKAPHDFGPGGFSERQFTVYFDINVGYQWQYWLMDEAEVIGNIHENPEILKGG